MERRRFALLAVVSVAVLTCTAMAPGAATAPAKVPDREPAAPSDFNGDGYADLAVGVPGNLRGNGLVHVIPGGADGLRGSASTHWSQSSSGVAGSADHDSFGFVVASADFNRDGFADLAVGSPLDDLSASPTGGVNVLYGSPDGVKGAGSQYWRAASSGMPVVADRFGIALAIGDFDGDGYADLAMGAPEPGAVLVVRGSAGGLSQEGVVLAGEPSAGASYGRALAAGDLNGDGADELIVGAPLHDGTTGWAGAVFVHSGSPVGLSADGTLVTAPDVGIAAGVAESAYFGAAIRTGDFDADGFDDLAVGAPDAVLGGLVAVLPGSATGAVASAAVLWTQGSPGIPGSSEAGDSFGGALATGNVSGDAADDLVIGVPGERLTGRRGRSHGAVLVLPGQVGSGLTTVGARRWTRDTPGVVGTAALGDRFGSALAIANYAGSSAADLAIGTPGQIFPPYADSGGSLTLLLGTSMGVTGTGSRVWSQESPQIAGRPGYDDRFGGSLTP